MAHSDTTGSTITLVFYHLAKHPAYQEQIREELKAVSSLSDIQSLQALVGLRSFVAEVLRLFPPVPTGGNRMTPKEGITVTGRYIPPHTTVSTPRYSISRRKYFPSQSCTILCLELSLVATTLTLYISRCRVRASSRFHSGEMDISAGADSGQACLCTILTGYVSASSSDLSIP